MSTWIYTKRKQAEEGGGREKLAQQRQKGKLTARERIIFLLDQDSFIELHPFMESQVLTKRTAHVRGWGRDRVRHN